MTARTTVRCDWCEVTYESDLDEDDDEEGLGWFRVSMAEVDAYKSWDFCSRECAARYLSEP